MPGIRKSAIAKRKFLARDFVIRSWKDIEPYVNHLSDFKITGNDSLREWLGKRSELDTIVEEDKAWLYIRQSCYTDKKEYADAFTNFVGEIEEPFSHAGNQLNQKLLDYCRDHEYPESYEIFIRSIRRQVEIFREENVKLLAELEVEEQKYGAVTGAMTINYGGKEITLQEAQNYLKSVDRDERRRVFELIWNRRKQDYRTLNQLLDKLLTIRHQVAINAGFPSYLEYRFAQLGRFDYSLKDCEEFHASVQQHVVPLLDEIHRIRREKLGYEELHIYDLDVDVGLKPALKPFEKVDELVSKTVRCFKEIDPDFGEFISVMDQNGYLDLDSRKGKAPGGYNYPLHESNVPFIFMNATNNLRDMETMMHEGGHAIHSFLSKDLEFVYFKETPAEIAEVASMAMELISMEHWHHFFGDETELKRAKISQLEGVLSVLPWVATVDKFQHWMYTHPGHSAEDRLQEWESIEKEFAGKIINWRGYEEHRKHLWQKQIHVFQFPLYYIEYGIAQLGAIGIWKNYKADPKKAIAQYRKSLSLGYTRTLPELYQAAGIQFDFSADHIRKLGEFVRSELIRLR